MKGRIESTFVIGMGSMAIAIISGCTGGGVCTRSCEEIEAELESINAEVNDDTDDLFGTEIGRLQCHVGQLALEAFDCNCEGIQELGGVRQNLVLAVQGVCSRVNDGILLPGFPNPAGP